MATLTVFINNRSYTCDASTTVAGAITQATPQLSATRQSVRDMPRTMVCGMGICFECRVTINGAAHQLACQTPVASGMRITYGEGGDAKL
ncbi:MAG: 2Fe-2S iron-sulfur cluster-binding protein [Chloroflexales bacterium]|nr:2Fe-2S iron-sulfur cluster-binding protein [Chloroflexales bacterium]